MINEFASLKQLHDSESQAVRKFYDLKQEVALYNHNAIYDEKKEDITTGEKDSLDVFDKTNILTTKLADIEEERENTRTDLEAMMSRVKREAEQSESLRQLRQQRLVDGSGKTLRDEISRVKMQYDEDRKIISEMLRGEATRRRLALDARLEAEKAEIQQNLGTSKTLSVETILSEAGLSKFVQPIQAWGINSIDELLKEVKDGGITDAILAAQPEVQHK